MPKGLHPSLAFILEDAQWFTYEQFSQSVSFEAQCQALSWRGLFTDYLGSLGIGNVGVELVRQGVIAEIPQMNRRDVRISVGQTMAAIASTLISEQVIQSEAWLRTLGNRPIGEMLENKLGAERADIRYAAIDSGSDLFRNFPDERALWGRRYRYKFSSGELSITEIIADSITAQMYNGATELQRS